MLRGIRVVVADDAALIRHAVRALLREAGAEVVAGAADGPGLRAAVERARPDVVVSDIRMPPSGVEGLRAATEIRRTRPGGTGILLLSNHAETRYLRGLVEDARAGVGYLLKERVADVSDFVAAVGRVAAGQVVVDPEIAALLVNRRRSLSRVAELTERERQVLTAMATGASNAAMADRLRLSVKTVETHIQRIFVKLDLYEDTASNRRVQAVLAYLQSSGP